MNTNFENDVKEWEVKRLEVRKSISKYEKPKNYFNQLEEMAFSTSFNKEEMNLYINQLQRFTSAMSGKEPELCADLNLFLEYCNILYKEREKIKLVAIKYNLAQDLLNSSGDKSKSYTGEGRQDSKDSYRKAYEEAAKEQQKRRQEEAEERKRREKQYEEEKELKEKQHREQERKEKELFKSWKKKQEKKNKNKKYLIVTSILLVVLAATLWDFFSKYNRKNILYTYTTNLALHSSKEANSENEYLGDIPYGTALTVYSNENGCAYVEINGEKGYVSSNYLLNAYDFQLLNGIWGNEEVKELISTAKCRLAVLDFLKSNNMQTGSSGWQIFAQSKEIKPNSVLLLNLNDGYDAFAELAFIITNNETSQRKLALYAFSKDETPIFRYSEDAPTQGDIKSITYNKWNEKYKVNYSNVKQISSTNETVKQDQENLNETSSSESSPNMVSILSVDFANVNFVNKILTDYGQPLYSDMEYLRPKIHYKKKLDKEENFKFQIKIIHPDNRLECNRISPTGYTFEQEVKLAEKEGYLDLKSWGSSNGDFYKAGSYRYEIWCNDQELHSSIVKIQETKITDKSGKLITTASDYKVYDNAEVMPEFPDGGYEGMKKYLREKVQHSRASKNGQKGHVLVECIIEADGSISNVKASKGVYHALNEDAVRIVMGMPKWKPGKIGNKAVRVKYTIPVSF